MPIPVHSQIHATQSPTTPLRNSQSAEHRNVIYTITAPLGRTSAT
jgi:hypothetical protein